MATENTPPPAGNAQQLKRLAPVAEKASAAAALAAQLYSTSKKYVPERLQGSVEAAESRVVGLASPYVPIVLDRTQSALQAVDAKVDGAITSAYQQYMANSEALGAAVASSRAAHAASLEQLAAARADYLKRVEASVSWVKEQGLQGTAKAAADGLLAKVEEARRVPEAALSQVSAAWGAFTTMPAVERLLAATRGQVEAAFVRYTSAHDVLVADPRYSAAVAKSGELLASLQQTAAFKAAVARLSPLLAPYAEGAAKVAGPYVTAVAQHLAPAPAAVPAQ